VNSPMSSVWRRHATYVRTIEYTAFIVLTVFQPTLLFGYDVSEDLDTLMSLERKEEREFVQRMELLAYLPSRQHAADDLTKALNHNLQVAPRKRALMIKGIGAIGTWEEKNVLLPLLADSDDESVLSAGEALAQICCELEWPPGGKGQNSEETRAYWKKWRLQFGNMDFEDYIRSKYQSYKTDEDKFHLIWMLRTRPPEQALLAYRAIARIEQGAEKRKLIASFVECLSGLKLTNDGDASSSFSAWAAGSNGVHVGTVVEAYGAWMDVTRPYNRKTINRLICALLDPNKQQARLYAQVLLNAYTNVRDPFGLMTSDQDSLLDAPAFYLLHQTQVANFWASELTGRALKQE